MRTERGFLYLGATAATSSTDYTVKVPYPKAGGAAFETSRMVDAARNANGSMVGRQIGRSLAKQNLAWDIIPCEVWWEMNRFFEAGHFTFYCCFFDFNLGEWKTRLFYVSDVKVSPGLVDAGSGEVKYLRDASFNVIDCGVM